MQAMKTTRAVVQPGGRIEVSTPELPVGQNVEVTIRPLDEPHRRGSARTILARSPGHRLFKSAEEVDAYIRAERDSWDR